MSRRTVILFGAGIRCSNRNGQKQSTHAAKDHRIDPQARKPLSRSQTGPGSPGLET
jgi:hypothetical protein